MRLIGLAVILIVSVLASFDAEAQKQAGKVFRIGVLTTVPLATLEASSLPSLLKAQGGSSADNSARCAGDLYGLVQWALCRVGYVEGQNIAIEARWGAPERLPAVAAELVRLKVDVIHAIGPVAIRAAKQATATIPIVMMTSGDPVALGFVESMARPGGNITGAPSSVSSSAGSCWSCSRRLCPERPTSHSSGIRPMVPT